MRFGSQRVTSPKCTDREGRENATQGLDKFEMSLEKRRLKYYMLNNIFQNVRIDRILELPQASVWKRGWVWSHWYEIDLMKYSHANKTHYHKRNFALSPVLKMRVFGTRKWPFTHLWSDFAPTEQPETPALWQSRWLTAHQTPSQYIRDHLDFRRLPCSSGQPVVIPTHFRSLYVFWETAKLPHP